MPESDVPDSPFQSTPPCAGGDNISKKPVGVNFSFQSTPPVRGATFSDLVRYMLQNISIHAPLCGGRRH